MVSGDFSGLDLSVRLKQVWLDSVIRDDVLFALMLNINVEHNVEHQATITFLS